MIRSGRTIAAHPLRHLLDVFTQKKAISARRSSKLETLACSPIFFSAHWALAAPEIAKRFHFHSIPFALLTIDPSAWRVHFHQG